MPFAPHHPPHIYLDDTWYIVTSSTYQNLPLLKTEGHKDLLRNQLKMLITEFNFQLAAWVILNNHYHLLIKSSIGKKLPSFFRHLHGRLSFDMNKQDGVSGRRIWHNYWDTCIRNKFDYWTRFNYIHHNPVKHGYVTRTEEWPYSSYQYYLKHKGEIWLQDLFQQYPIVDFTDPEDSF